MHPAGIFVFSEGRYNDGCCSAGICLRNQVDTFGSATIDKYLIGVNLMVLSDLPGQAFGQYFRVAVDATPLAEKVFLQPSWFTSVPDVRAKVGANISCVAVAIVAMSVEHKSGFDKRSNYVIGHENTTFKQGHVAALNFLMIYAVYLDRLLTTYRSFVINLCKFTRSTMIAAQRLTKAQQALLELFSFDMSETEVLAMRQTLMQHFRQRLENEAQQAMEQKNVNLEQLEAKMMFDNRTKRLRQIRDTK